MKARFFCVSEHVLGRSLSKKLRKKRNQFLQIKFENYNLDN